MELVSQERQHLCTTKRVQPAEGPRVKLTVPTVRVLSIILVNAVRSPNSPKTSLESGYGLTSGAGAVHELTKPLSAH